MKAKPCQDGEQKKVKDASPGVVRQRPAESEPNVPITDESMI